MTPEQLAARWLADVPRLETWSGNPVIWEADALAAIARHLAPGDDLVERLMSWDGCWPAPWIERALPEAAARLSALTAERDGVVNQLDNALHSVDVLEKRVSTLRDRLARMEGDQERIMRIAAGLFPGGYDNNLAMIRAALTDGGSNGLV